MDRRQVRRTGIPARGSRFSANRETNSGQAKGSNPERPTQALDRITANVKKDKSDKSAAIPPATERLETEVAKTRQPMAQSIKELGFGELGSQHDHDQSHGAERPHRSR